MCMNEKNAEAYNRYVESVTPTHNLWLQMLKAFLVGGIICVIGQLINDVVLRFISVDKTVAASFTSMFLILISVILTSIGVYPIIAKFGGAGTLVPITGFANSMVATAIEFKKEGQVFGIGCKIFNIAGPVILYGIVSSWLLGLIYWAIKMFM